MNKSELRKQAPPPKATTLQLIFITYAIICSGAYGLEEIVSKSGPGLAMLILLILPIVYALPMALICSELAAKYPVEGGYYRWVSLAFGKFIGYNVGWLIWLTMFATNASFAVLFSNYLRCFIPNLSEKACFIVSVILVWVVVLLNYRGISFVGTASVILTLLIFVPFIVMIIMGLPGWNYNPISPFINSDKPAMMALLNGVLIAIWLYGGFERITVNAEEVENPIRAFPIALLIAVPLCALSYIIPTFVALAANGDWKSWGESYFTVAAAKIGGPWLRMLMAGGGLISNATILMTTMLSHSRLPMVLAEDKLFPGLLARRHPRFGTPIVSLLITGIILTVFCKFRLSELISIYALVQSLAYLLIYATMFRLFFMPTDSKNAGFRIPFGTGLRLLLILPGVLISGLVIGQGLSLQGSLGAHRTIIHILIFASGPITFFLLRWCRLKLDSDSLVRLNSTQP